MPPPRRLSPRRKDRRSRSHSPKVLHKKRRSRTRSPVRERKRSRSPYRKRSRSRERHHSPQRRRSRTPERLSPPRRKSLGTKRRSSSPHDYDQPIKRQADSTRRTYRSKSRSHSPLPVKKDSRRDESPEDRGYSRRRSPSPTYGGKLYSDQQSSSSKRNQRKDEIEMVKIVDMGKKLPKLDKRFQTLEQLAQGSFDFEENITIGIHRGPHGHQLDNDEDIPVNYNFNPKTFIMLFPKKDYTIPVFDRDEIKAFHHDDILDEEAYVEKRTITVKPTGKPKPSTSRGSGGGSSSRYRDMDYKITIGADRGSSYGDRRMVHDSGSSKSRSSRHDPEVKIRLDPKPDPKYERMYKEQQRQENRNLEDKIHRNPSDLRYSLMRKKSFDGDRESDRGRGRDSSLLDARARIEAKRQGGTDQGDYGSRDMSPPPTRMEKRKIGIKTELPDFKNRPGKPIENPEVWIIGASVIKDIAHAQQDDKLPQLIKLMKDTVKSIKWHGESDMNIKDLLPAVKYMLKENDTKPDIIIFQCGEYDVCVGRNVDHQSVMKDHVEQIMKELPGVKLIWSQTFPPWMTTEPAGESLAKSRRRINRFMIKVFCSEEVDGAFIYHPHFRTNRKAKFFKDKHDGFLHLTNPGLEMYLMQLKAGINYIMSGQGCIYPYIQWPPISMARIPPEDICMLCKEHILDINEHMIYGMSKDQIQQFSNDQIEMFQPLQKQWLYCQYFIENLSQDQVKAFTLDQYKFMNLDQLLIWREEHGSVLSEEVLTYLTKKEKVLRKRMRNKNAEMNENGESEWSEDSLDEEEYDFEAYEDERYDMVEVREKVRTGRGRGRGNFRGRGRGRGDFRGRGREDFRGRGRGGFRGRGRGDFRGRGRGGFQSSGNDHERSENFDYDRGSPSEFDARNYSRQSDDLILGERFESRGRHRSRERRRSTESDHRRRSRSGHRRSGSRRVPSRDRRRRRHSSESSYSSESDYMSESRSRSPSPRRRRKQGRGSPNRNNHPHPGPHFPPGFPPGPMGFPPLQPPGMPMLPMGMPLGFPTPQYPYMPPPPPGSVPVHFPYPVPGPFLPNPAAPVQPDPTAQVYVPASQPELSFNQSNLRSLT